MPNIEEDFRGRLNDVSIYLRSLRTLEKKQSNKAGVVKPSKTLAASRAAAFIMIYNCVEFATKEAFASIRRDMMGSVQDFSKLIVYWQEEIVRIHFDQKLGDGVNHAELLREFRTFLPGRITWLTKVEALPFSGNINHEKLIDLARKIGDKKWRPPKSTMGGLDLEFVRTRRNELAHGDEAFATVGGALSIDDIAEKMTRIRAFMCSYLRMIERYRTNKKYIN
jgi:hypothetical protein